MSYKSNDRVSGNRLSSFASQLWEKIKNTFALANHSHSDATTSASGFMSSTDKSKLDGIADNANNYSLPTASSTTLGGVKVGTNLSISDGVLSANDTSFANVHYYCSSTYWGSTSSIGDDIYNPLIYLEQTSTGNWGFFDRFYLQWGPTSHIRFRLVIFGTKADVNTRQVLVEDYRGIDGKNLVVTTETKGDTTTRGGVLVRIYFKNKDKQAWKNAKIWRLQSSSGDAAFDSYKEWNVFSSRDKRSTLVEPTKEVECSITNGDSTWAGNAAKATNAYYIGSANNNHAFYTSDSGHLCYATINSNGSIQWVKNIAQRDGNGNYDFNGNAETASRVKDLGGTSGNTIGFEYNGSGISKVSPSGNETRANSKYLVALTNDGGNSKYSWVDVNNVSIGGGAATATNAYGSTFEINTSGNNTGNCTVKGASGNIVLSSSSNENQRGIWLQAHGTDTAGKWALVADTNNNVTLNGNADTSTTATYLKQNNANEINFKNVNASSAYYVTQWFNYRNGDSGSKDSTKLITTYKFGNRNGTTNGVTLDASSFTGSAAKWNNYSLVVGSLGNDANTIYIA